MASRYDEVFVALYRAPFDDFVAVRKRFAAELKASGDGAGAARLAAVTRPPVSAWAVNQLWWKDRKAFDALFKTAERLRDVDADAEETAAHRDAITKLRQSAAKLLGEAGKSTTEATLRRVTSTLTALAATGSFDPDPPGALKGDRDPPGFDVRGLLGSRPSKSRPKLEKAAPQPKPAEVRRREKAEAVAERRRLEREHAQEKADRDRLERKLRIAESVLEARREEVARLEESLREAKRAVEESRGALRELERELAKR